LQLSLNRSRTCVRSLFHSTCALPAAPNPAPNPETDSVFVANRYRACIDPFALFISQPSNSCGLWPKHSASFKEVIQPQVPLRLPCYDFTPVMNHTVVIVLPKVRLTTSGAIHSHGVTGGVYKARERIHRDILIRDY